MDIASPPRHHFRPARPVHQIVGRLVLPFVVFAVTAGRERTADGYHTDHPVVVGMVQKGVEYLEGLSRQGIMKGSWGGEEFHPVLVAYAHFKAVHDDRAPIVRDGVRQARSFAARLRGGLKRGSGSQDKNTYGICTCIFLLCEVGPEKYAAEIKLLRNTLFSIQMPNGGWGYPGERQGDTSQVQYVVLALWTLDQKGFEVPNRVVNGVHAWLMRVQDKNGAWPYRATDPGPNKGLITQGTKYMSHSTALAGASSVLIAGDFFQMWRKPEPEGEVPEGFPEAVFPAEQSKIIRPDRTGKSVVKRDQIFSAVRNMNQYRASKPYERGKLSGWHYYSLYSLERFESFHEFAREESVPEPDWYNQVIDQLKKDQHSSGGWGISDSASSPPPVATAFAILFLVRSTKAAINAPKAGSTAGGRSLPGDTTEILVDGSQIKAKKLDIAVDGLLDILEGDGANNIEGKSIPEDLVLSKEPSKRAAEIDRMKRLVRGSQSWQARRVATRLIAQCDELHVAPTLIFALTDPDPMVPRYARDGLRFLSRKFEGFGLPDSPSGAEIRQVSEKWKQWYLTVDPGYIFLDD